MSGEGKLVKKARNGFAGKTRGLNFAEDETADELSAERDFDEVTWDEG